MRTGGMTTPRSEANWRRSEAMRSSRVPPRPDVDRRDELVADLECKHVERERRLDVFAAPGPYGLLRGLGLALRGLLGLPLPGRRTEGQRDGKERERRHPGNQTQIASSHRR